MHLYTTIHTAYCTVHNVRCIRLISHKGMRKRKKNQQPINTILMIIIIGYKFNKLHIRMPLRSIFITPQRIQHKLFDQLINRDLDVCICFSSSSSFLSFLSFLLWHRSTEHWEECVLVSWICIYELEALRCLSMTDALNRRIKFN